MKTTPLSLVAALLALALLGGSTRADDEVPLFKKRGDMEKQFVESVGVAIVKAARSGPKKIELDKYAIVDTKKDRKDMEITMNWSGGLTGKKFTSTIVVKIDSSNKDRWEVLNIEYKDNSISPTKPNANKIQDLVKKFNK